MQMESLATELDALRTANETARLTGGSYDMLLDYKEGMMAALQAGVQVGHAHAGTSEMHLLSSAGSVLLRARASGTGGCCCGLTCDGTV